MPPPQYAQRLHLCATSPAASQQLSGINTIFYFSTRIFKQANVENGDLATAIVGGRKLSIMLPVMFRFL
jgi:hypothetical protein